MLVLLLFTLSLSLLSLSICPCFQLSLPSYFCLIPHPPFLLLPSFSFVLFLPFHNLYPLSLPHSSIFCLSPWKDLFFLNLTFSFYFLLHLPYTIINRLRHYLPTYPPFSKIAVDPPFSIAPELLCLAEVSIWFSRVYSEYNLPVFDR